MSDGPTKKKSCNILCGQKLIQGVLKESSFRRNLNNNSVHDRAAKGKPPKRTFSKKNNLANGLQSLM